jgi:hypothetical protein
LTEAFASSSSLQRSGTAATFVAPAWSKVLFYSNLLFSLTHKVFCELGQLGVASHDASNSWVYRVPGGVFVFQVPTPLQSLRPSVLHRMSSGQFAGWPVDLHT